ncbi:hypothetical protein BN1013_01700 [Candidatus Rubidus massiliensis]|nr:MAG: hypothetical protein BGO10_08955 [Chlamydia sp. 32-24]CDZ81169.1 hypothetical protein BN1013_01700 [Candidatus Rubidus massiliensis]
MQWITLFTILISLLTSCGPRYVDFFPYHDDGRLKPQVAILPISNHDTSLGSDISMDVMRGLRQELMSQGNVFVFDEKDYPCAKESYFGSDLDFANVESCAQYVVAIEIFPHETKFYPTEIGCVRFESFPCHTRVTLSGRARVIDLTCERPRIILQEKFSQEFAVPIDIETVTLESCYNNDPFLQSTFRLSYQRLAKQIAKKVEQVVTYE